MDATTYFCVPKQFGGQISPCYTGYFAYEYTCMMNIAAFHYLSWPQYMCKSVI